MLLQMPNQKKGTPSWVERGLNMIDNSAEVLVIDQRSSTNSGFECDRSSCNGSDEGRYVPKSLLGYNRYQSSHLSGNVNSIISLLL